MSQLDDAKSKPSGLRKLGRGALALISLGSDATALWPLHSKATVLATALLIAAVGYLESGLPFLRAMKDSWPWLIAILVLLAAYLRIVWHEATKASRLVASREMTAECQRRLDALERDHGEEREKLKAVAHTLIAERDIARNETAGAIAEARGYLQHIRYGRSLTLEEVADTLEFESMRHALQELKPSLGRLAAASDRLWNSILAAVAGSQSDTPLGHILGDFRNREWMQSNNAMNALMEILDAKSRDPRPLIEGSYKAYRDWRARLLQLFSWMERDLTELRDFEDWKLAEQEYHTELRKKLAIGPLARTRRAIGEFDVQAGPLA